MGLNTNPGCSHETLLLYLFAITEKQFYSSFHFTFLATIATSSLPILLKNLLLALYTSILISLLEKLVKFYLAPTKLVCFTFYYMRYGKADIKGDRAH